MASRGNIKQGVTRVRLCVQVPVRIMETEEAQRERAAAPGALRKWTSLPITPNSSTHRDLVFNGLGWLAIAADQCALSPLSHPQWGHHQVCELGSHTQFACELGRPHRPSTPQRPLAFRNLAPPGSCEPRSRWCTTPASNSSRRVNEAGG